jgi:hypothetical protein
MTSLRTIALLLAACLAVGAQQYPPTPSVAAGWTVSGGTTSTPPTWSWVNVGVAAEVMGNSLDWATSWKQPEGNQLLAQQSGNYTGELYRTGTNRKIAVAGSLAIVSYAIGWKWPKLRKYVGIFDMVSGATWTGVAFSNVARNPYYR